VFVPGLEVVYGTILHVDHANGKLHCASYSDITRRIRTKKVSAEKIDIICLWKLNSYGALLRQALEACSSSRSPRFRQGMLHLRPDPTGEGWEAVSGDNVLATAPYECEALVAVMEAVAADMYRKG
jgi:hypothetical protein